MKKLINLLLAIFLVSSVSAIEFSITGVNINPSGVYQGDSPTLTAKVTADQSNFCNIICSWSINVGPDFSGIVSGDSNNPPTILATGEEKTFPFRVNANGQGSTSYILSVTCDNENQFCLASEVTHQYSNTLSFDYAGDGTCTTSKEKCENYGDYTGTNDCACTNPPKECRPDSEREADDYGCATYCGNGIAEEGFETCSSCPKDVGQCDGYVGCVSGNECEGNFCVHEVCWNKAWRDGDNFCDINEGESCKNSNDCACQNDELCSNEGICKKPETTDEEINEAIQGGVQETLEASKSRQKNITTGAIILIILVVVSYISYKFMKDKKHSKKRKKK